MEVSAIEKVAIIAPGEYPIPALKGGAIETLIDYLIEENEKNKEYEFWIYSVLDEEALKKSRKFKNVKFRYFKINKTLNIVNNFIIRIIRKLFKFEPKTILMRKIIRDLKENNFNKVIIEGNENQILQVRKSYKGKLYFHLHHDAFNTFKGNPKKVINACDKIIAVSKYIKDRTLKINNKVKIDVVENCINVNVFNKDLYINERDVLREKYNIKKDEIAIIFTGRTIPQKGVKELIEAFKIICKDEKVKLIIVGNAGFANEIKSSYDKQLFELAKDISEQIIFTGFIHNSDLPKIYAMADIAVVPSIWEEPAGLVAIEALATGLPLIVTNSGGLNEYATQNSAIIIDKDNKLIDNLAKELKKLIESKDLRRDMAIKARKQGIKYNTEKYYKDYINSLKE